MAEIHSVLIIAVISLVTVLLRFLPFLIFSGKRKTPQFLLWLGQVLPCAVMGMLVVYCLRNVSLFSSSHGIPELVSCLLVVLLYLWKKNSLISITGGTICYMLLVQLVFK